MDLVLWIVAVAMAVVFTAGGLAKLTIPKDNPAVVDLLRQAEVLLGEIGENVVLCRNHRMPR